VNLRDSLLAVLVALLWGLNFVAMRFVLVVVPWIFFVRKPDVSWKAIIGVGLFMSAGQFGLLYLAMALGMPAGLASLVLQAQVLLTVLLAAAFLGERPSRRQLAGVVLGVAGLALVAVGRSAVAPLLPLVIVLAAALSWAAGNVIVRRAKAASGLGLVVWSGAVVPLPLGGLSLLLDGRIPCGAHCPPSRRPPSSARSIPRFSPRWWATESGTGSLPATRRRPLSPSPCWSRCWA